MTATDLEIVVARMKHERFRELTSEDNPDVVQRDAYRDLVARLAAGGDPTPPRPSVDESSAQIRAMKACPHRTPAADCGCGGMARCGLGRGRGDGLVAPRECMECRAADAGGHHINRV